MSKTLFAGALALALTAPAFAAEPAPAAEKAKSECCVEKDDKDGKEKKGCCCDGKEKKEKEAASATGGAEEHKGHAGL